MKIGDTLYKWDKTKGVLFSYEITGIRRYKNEKEKYELICNNCSHSVACKILVVEGESGSRLYNFVEMIRDDERDDCFAKEHYCFHQGDLFFTTKYKAYQYGLTKIIDNYEKKIKENKENIAYLTKEINLIKGFLDTVKDEVSRKP